MPTNNHVGTQNIPVLTPNTALTLPDKANECIVRNYGGAMLWEGDGSWPSVETSHIIGPGRQLEILGGQKRQIMERLRLSPKPGHKVRVKVEYYD